MHPAPPPDASLAAPGADALLGLITRFALVALVAFALALALVLVLARRRSIAPPPRTAHVAGAVTVAVLAMLVADAGLVGAAHRDAVARLWGTPRGAGVVRVEAMAQRFSWSFRHAGPDGRFGTADDPVELDALHVPAGAPIVVALAARDVGHSFFVPALRIKQDAIPGRLALLHFAVRSPGELEVACAQFCGPSHYRMRARLVALARDAFDRWISTASARSMAVTDATPEEVSGRAARSGGSSAANRRTTGHAAWRPESAAPGWAWPWRD